MIPFVDLAAMHRECEPELSAAVASVVASGRYVLGPELEAFEQEYAEVCGVKHCVGVGNGTDALELALRATGVGPGDLVAVPALTFAATALAVVRTGARPLFVDVDPGTLLMDIGDPRIEECAAAIPVDLYGQRCPLPHLDYRRVVEDAAQSHGLRCSAIAATSFYPSKNLGALGDGGAVITNLSSVAESVRELRNHGGRAKYQHERAGWNSRLDEIQAAVLRVKLAHLDAWNEQRAQAAAVYDDLLGFGQPDMEFDVARPVETRHEHAHHLYVVRVADRDRVVAAMAAAGVEVGVHYPAALTQIPALADYVTEPCPVAEKAATEVLSLPMFPTIALSQQERVVEALARALLG